MMKNAGYEDLLYPDLVIETHLNIGSMIVCNNYLIVRKTAGSLYKSALLYVTSPTIRQAYLQQSIFKIRDLN